MSARTFEDSAGTVWEVFEVRRTSQNAQAVTPGLELGWLAFVSGTQKRRLAPFPADWGTVAAGELERLCGAARVARPAILDVNPPPIGDVGSDATPRPRVPRIRPARGSGTTPETGELPIVSSATSADSVEATVREFAHQARSRGLPAIEAMVRLKALLARVYVDPASAARDLRAVRRWFVDTYYFEHRGDAPADAPAGAPDQSR